MRKSRILENTLYDVTPDPMTGGGIFTALQNKEVPWAEEDMALLLDVTYYGNYSGSKITSVLIDRMLNGSDQLTAEQTGVLADILYKTNINSWTREWEIMAAEYDPIQNYNMEEDMTDDETVTEYGKSHTRTDNLSHSETRTDNLSHSETRTDNLSHSETRTDNLSHSETRTDNLSHSETRTDNLSHSETRTDNLVHSETRTDNLSHSETRTDNLSHSETRTDNLTHTYDGEEKTTPGVTTTRQDSTRGFNSSSDVLTDKVTESASGYSKKETDITEHNTGTVGTTGSNTGTQSTQGTNTGTVGTQGSNTGTQQTAGTNTGTQGVTGTNTGTVGTQGSNTGTVTDADTGSDTSTRNYKLTRKGNIGVTTTQQMLESERDLWLWNYFYEVVFPSVDKLLTIPAYGSGSETVTGFQPSGTILITHNGEINVYNYETANVQVPNSYVAADEGKVVNNGALVAQGSLAILANGPYDTTLINNVSVAVSNSYTAEDEGKVVSNGALVDQGSLAIIANGPYDTTLIKSVSVDVPNSYTAGDEGKVVSNGALVAQGSQEITENGLFDTTLIKSVSVNVGQLFTPTNISIFSVNPSNDASASLTGGYEFTVDRAYKVAGFRFFPRSNTVNIYLAESSDGTIIYQVLGVSVTVGQWNNIMFDNQIVLETGKTYVLYGSNTDLPMKFARPSGIVKCNLIDYIRTLSSTVRDQKPTSVETGNIYGVDMILEIGI